MNTTPPPATTLQPPCEVRMFCRGQDQSCSIQEFRAVDPNTGGFDFGAVPTYIGHAVALVKCKTDRGLQEIPHPFQFPITAHNVAEAFELYEHFRNKAFEVEISNLRRQAIINGATLNELPKEAKRL